MPKTRRHKKQKVYKMIGCNKKNKSCKNKQQCTNCGPNCHCINCTCPKGCPGNCYLGRRLKGGSGCGPGGCPIAPMSWHQMQRLSGGGSIPGPFVGQPWTANAWPGQNGISNDNNYLASYKDVVANDPSYHQSMYDSGYKVGGYTYSAKVFPKSTSRSYSKSKSKSRSKRSDFASSRSRSKSSTITTGGGFIPQDLVNLGRDMMYNVNSAYNALNGYKAPVNPLPYKDQLINK